jgi:hypothetical protein
MRTSFVLASAPILVASALAGFSAGCGGSKADDGASTSDDAGGGAATDAPVEAHSDAGAQAVGPDGGTVSSLLFTTIGDTRPPNEDDVGGYPTAIIDKLYEDISALKPAPLFTISTGDFQYSSPHGGQATQQLSLYLAARAKFPGVFFPVMGNHECTGSTDSNCGPGNQSGETDNYTAFMTQLLGPIHKTNPYYSVNINATDGSWTSKFVFIAANAWDSTQQTWLTQTMAQKTTYTFAVRHEGTGVVAPGVAPSDQILNAAGFTLLIVGHSHTVEHTYVNQVLFGNGGAPLSSGNYGYGVFSRRASDGAIVVDSYDYMTNQADPSFHFAVKPDGTLAPAE